MPAKRAVRDPLRAAQQRMARELPRRLQREYRGTLAVRRRAIKGDIEWLRGWLATQGEPWPRDYSGVAERRVVAVRIEQLTALVAELEEAQRLERERRRETAATKRAQRRAPRSDIPFYDPAIPDAFREGHRRRTDLPLAERGPRTEIYFDTTRMRTARDVEAFSRRAAPGVRMLAGGNSPEVEIGILTADDPAVHELELQEYWYSRIARPIASREAEMTPAMRRAAEQRLQHIWPLLARERARARKEATKRWRAMQPKATRKVKKQVQTNGDPTSLEYLMAHGGEAGLSREERRAVDTAHPDLEAARRELIRAQQRVSPAWAVSHQYHDAEARQALAEQHVLAERYYTLLERYAREYRAARTAS